MDFSEENPYSVSSLGAAVRLNSIEDLNRLLQTRRHVDIKDNRGWTPLHNASIDCKFRECLLALLKAGANINARTFEGESPLFLACKHNCLDLATILIDHGAVVDLPNNENVTPLHIASFLGWYRIAKLLIQRSADVNMQDYSFCSPLHEAITGGHYNVCKILLLNGASLLARDRDLNLPIHFACIYGNLETLLILLNAYRTEKDIKTAVNSRNVDKFTPLMLAVQKKNMELIEELLRRGADANLVGFNGQNRILALHLAAHTGVLRILDTIYKVTSKEAVEKYCSINNLNDIMECRGSTQKSLTCLVIDTESIECLEYLLGCGLSSKVLNCPIVEETKDYVDYLAVTPCILDTFYNDDIILVHPVNFLLKEKLYDLMNYRESHLVYLRMLLQNGLRAEFLSYYSEISSLHAFVALATMCKTSRFNEYQKATIFTIIVDCVSELVKHGTDPDLYIPGIQSESCNLPFLFVFACKTSCTRLLPFLFQHTNLIEPDDLYAWILNEMFITQTFNFDINTNLLLLFLLKIVTKSDMPEGLDCTNIPEVCVNKFYDTKQVIYSHQQVPPLKQIVRPVIRKAVRQSCSFPQQFRIRLNSLSTFLPSCIMSFLNYEELQSIYESVYIDYCLKFLNYEIGEFKSALEEWNLNESQLNELLKQFRKRSESDMFRLS